MVTLVTGASGFLGSYVIEALIESGEKVISFSNSPFTRQIRTYLNLTQINGDILERDKFLALLKSEGVSNIIHLAGIISSIAQKNPLAATYVNCVGTVNVLECAIRAKCKKIVFASSVQVYGNLKGKLDQFIDEETCPDPMSVYGATKLFGEKIGLSYLNDLEFVVLRICPCFGFGNVFARSELVDNRVERSQRIIEFPIVGKPVSVRSGGRELVDFVYVEDAAKTVVNATISESLPHRVYNVSSGELHCLQDFESAIKRHYPNAEIELGLEPDPLYKSSLPLNTSLARKELGHEPRPFSENIERYIELAESEAHRDKNTV
jgi:UDP-glucose 4-epimerase